jgi:hypothetical protein
MHKSANLFGICMPPWLCQSHYFFSSTLPGALTKGPGSEISLPCQRCGGDRLWRYWVCRMTRVFLGLSENSGSELLKTCQGYLWNYRVMNALVCEGLMSSMATQRYFHLHNTAMQPLLKTSTSVIILGCLLQPTDITLWVMETKTPVKGIYGSTAGLFVNKNGDVSEYLLRFPS